MKSRIYSIFLLHLLCAASKEKNIYIYIYSKLVLFSHRISRTKARFLPRRQGGWSHSAGDGAKNATISFPRVRLPRCFCQEPRMLTRNILPVFPSKCPKISDMLQHRRSREINYPSRAWDNTCRLRHTVTLVIRRLPLNEIEALECETNSNLGVIYPGLTIAAEFVARGRETGWDPPTSPQCINDLKPMKRVY